MGCCCSSQKSSSPASPSIYRPQKGQCTDIICLLFFLVFFIGMAVIAVYGCYSGSIYGTFYGYDSMGNSCGFDNRKIGGPDLTFKKYRFCFNYDNFGGTLLGTVDNDVATCICTEKCPNIDIPLNRKGKRDFISYEKSVNASLCSYFKKDRPKKIDRRDTDSYSSLGPCPKMGDDENGGMILTKTAAFMHRCVPLDQTKALIVVGKMFANQDYIQKSVLSVYQTSKPIGISLLGAIGASFIMLILMRFLAGIVAWIMTIGLCILSLFLSISLWILKFQPSLLNQIINKVNEISNDQNIIPENLLQDIQFDENFILISAIIVSVFTVLLITFVCCMRDRTEISIDLIKQASKVFTSAPLLFFTPILVLSILVAFWASWCFIFVSIITSQDNPQIKKTTNDSSAFLYEFIKYSKFYYLFGVFWVTEFILACQYLVIAGTTVKWYFRRLERKRKNESTGCCSDLCQFPLFASISRVIFKHLGTAAFGSFIITLVQIPRAILLYVHKKLKDANQDNGFVKFLMCCMQCFLKCVEKCLRYLTTNAYIMTMVNSKNFCWSAGDALELLSSNPLQVQSIEMITWSMLFLGRLLVATGSGAFVAFEIFRNDNIELDEVLNNVDHVVPYKFVPIIVAFVAGYFISKVFFGLFDMVVKTLVISYCWDCKMNSGYEGEEHFMSKDMMLTMQKSNDSLRRYDRGRKYSYDDYDDELRYENGRF